VDERLRESQPTVLIAVLSHLIRRGGDSERGLVTEAFRNAIIAEIERKNADHLASTMVRLDRSATTFTYVSIWLAFVGTVLAFIQVCLAWRAS
jgi:hypothetical protein